MQMEKGCRNLKSLHTQEPQHPPALWSKPSRHDSIFSPLFRVLSVPTRGQAENWAEAEQLLNERTRGSCVLPWSLL